MRQSPQRSLSGASQMTWSRPGPLGPMSGGRSIQANPSPHLFTPAPQPSRRPGRTEAPPRAAGLSLAIALALALCLAAIAPAQAAKVEAVFQPLEKHLIAQGMTPKQAASLLSSPKLNFEGRLLSRLLARPEKTLNYGQFLKPYTVKRAKKFQREHKKLLAATQKATGVPPGVVVAILSVETGLGAYTGRHSTMSVLCSQAVLDTERARQLLYRHWPKKQRRYFHSKEFRARLARRAKWARGEVVALIQLAGQHHLSPYDYKGSVAGAMGMCQFVPSSVLNHGADGDGDGKIELHHTADAVRSVGVYLQRHGWKPGMTRKQQVKVVLTYNKSRPYANTVLDLAGKLP